MMGSFKATKMEQKIVGTKNRRKINSRPNICIS